MKGMTTCNVCGRDFALMAEEHYVVRDSERKEGVISALSGRQEADLYDAFNCPHCGCQNVMQGRKHIWLPEKQDECKSSEHNGCFGCKYATNEEDEYPCNECENSYVDKWEKKED